MTAILIDPFTKTVEAWEPTGAWLDALRTVLDCVQVDSVLVQDHICLWFDNLGLLKKKDQRYWRFIDNEHRFAGRAVLTGIDDDGMPTPLPLPPDGAKGIDWCEGDYPGRVFEELVVEDTPLGPWPRVIRKVVWNHEDPVIAMPPPPEDPEGVAATDQPG
jgi:hypothetical protein